MFANGGLYSRKCIVSLHSFISVGIAPAEKRKKIEKITRRKETSTGQERGKKSGSEEEQERDRKGIERGQEKVMKGTGKGQEEDRKKPVNEGYLKGQKSKYLKFLIF